MLCCHCCSQPAQKDQSKKRRGSAAIDCPADVQSNAVLGRVNQESHRKHLAPVPSALFSGACWVRTCSSLAVDHAPRPAVHKLPGQSFLSDHSTRSLLTALCSTFRFVLAAYSFTSLRLHAARGPSEASRRPRGRILPRSCRRPYCSYKSLVSMTEISLDLECISLSCITRFFPSFSCYACFLRVCAPPPSSSLLPGCLSWGGWQRLTSAFRRRSNAAAGAGCPPFPRRAPLCAGPVRMNRSSQQSGLAGSEERGFGRAVRWFRVVTVAMSSWRLASLGV
jgi:hypothetical protein